MTINIMLDDGAIMPTKAHDTDAGFDIYTRERVLVRKHDSVTVDTGVHVEIPKGYVGMLKSKSGLNVKKNIVGEGVIDAGYTGTIVVKLYNLGDNHYIFNAGDKLIQLVIIPIPDVELVQVTEFAETERGDNGFGSSGR